MRAFPRPGAGAAKRANEGVDRGLHGSENFTLASLAFKAKQVAQLDVATYQRDELLGGKPCVRHRQGAGCDRALNEGLDLEALPLGSGAPEHLSEPRKASGLAHYDAVQRDRIG